MYFASFAKINIFKVFCFDVTAIESKDSVTKWRKSRTARQILTLRNLPNRRRKKKKHERGRNRKDQEEVTRQKKQKRNKSSRKPSKLMYLRKKRFLPRHRLSMTPHPLRLVTLLVYLHSHGPINCSAQLLQLSYIWIYLSGPKAGSRPHSGGHCVNTFSNSFWGTIVFLMYAYKCVYYKLLKEYSLKYSLPIHSCRNVYSVSSNPLEIEHELTMDYPLDTPFDSTQR